METEIRRKIQDGVFNDFSVESVITESGINMKNVDQHAHRIYAYMRAADNFNRELDFTEEELRDFIAHAILEMETA